MPAQGVKGVVIVPLGFVSDHMEVVWDLDTEALETCGKLGVVATRVPTPGTHRKFVSGIVDLICERTAANNIADRPHLTRLGPWYDVCRPGCCANFRGEKPAIAAADTTVGTGHDPYPATPGSAPAAGRKMPVTVRIGTRASKLALTQTQQTADQLSAVGGFPVELVHVKTDGDVLTGSLSQMGGTGVFVAALRDALLREECDVAVHSLKDLPTGPAVGLTLAATPKRADVRDVLCARDGLKLADLPAGATVGTGSPRRAAQLRAVRPDLEILDIRGNVDTRLGRVPGLPGNTTDAVVAGKSCDLDAVVLAAAGLHRIGRLDAVSEFLESDVMLPAAGQGALAIECRTADAPRKAGSTEGSQGVLAQALAALDDPDTRLAVTAERALLARLEAGCAAPVGAYAYRKGSMLHLEAVVCAVDGTRRGPGQKGH